MALLTKCHKAPWSPNKCAFSNRLNSLTLSHCRSLDSNEFHRRGPPVVKHWSPKVLCERRTTHIAVSVERSRRTSQMSPDSSFVYAAKRGKANKCIKQFWLCVCVCVCLLTEAAGATATVSTSSDVYISPTLFIAVVSAQFIVIIVLVFCLCKCHIRKTTGNIMHSFSMCPIPILSYLKYKCCTSIYTICCVIILLSCYRRRLLHSSGWSKNVRPMHMFACIF